MTQLLPEIVRKLQIQHRSRSLAAVNLQAKALRVHSTSYLAWTLAKPTNPSHNTMQPPSVERVSHRSTENATTQILDADVVKAAYTLDTIQAAFIDPALARQNLEYELTMLYPVLRNTLYWIDRRSEPLNHQKPGLADRRAYS